jgi:hypothetical protein
MSLKFYVREGNVKISHMFCRPAPSIRLELCGHQQPTEQTDAGVPMYGQIVVRRHIPHEFLMTKCCSFTRD